MKNLKYVFGSVLMIAILIPQLALASWWNPFSWFQKKAPTTPVVQVASKENQPSVVSSSGAIKPFQSETSPARSSGLPVYPPTVKSTTETVDTKKIIPKALVVKLSNSQIIKKVKPATVYIETADGSGSGMIISSDGYILTNAHVVKGFSNVNITISTGEKVSGNVVGRDEAVDVAIIKLVSNQSFPKVELGNSSNLEQGDNVFAIGFPFGLKGDASFTVGVVSRFFSDYIGHSAEIHPGNSGGPLVNQYGQVVGINTASYTDQVIEGVQLGETIKLAIPINTANNLIVALKAGRNIIVESQKEKQAKQDIANKSACLAKSEEYYNTLVNSINQLSADNSDLQNLITPLDQNIEKIKQDLASQISDITSTSDNYISELKRIANSSIQSFQTSGARSGQTNEYLIAQVNDKLNKDVAYYESQKRSQIAIAQGTADISIAKYEALKLKAKNDKEIHIQNLLKNAKDEKTDYYNKCSNQ